MCAEDAIDVETDQKAANLFQKVLDKKKQEPPVPEDEEELRTRLGGVVRERLVALSSEGANAEGSEVSVSTMAAEVLKGLEDGQILFGIKPRVEGTEYVQVWKKTLRIKQQKNADQLAVNLAMVGLTVRDDQDPSRMKQFFTPDMVKQLYEFHTTTPLDATRFTTAMLTNITLKEPGLGEFPKVAT